MTRLHIEAPLPHDQVSHVVAWSAEPFRLREDWLITVKHAPTDWPYDHSHGVAYADRRGVVVWIPRSFEPGAPIQDVWSFLVYIIGHELQHCAQHERDYPGSSQQEPADVEDVADAEPAPEPEPHPTLVAQLDRVTLPEMTAAENAEANSQAISRLREEERAAAQERDAENEREAQRAGIDRLNEWHEYATFERDQIKLGKSSPPPVRWS
jgi:hypothetical protein